MLFVFPPLYTGYQQSEPANVADVGLGWGLMLIAIDNLLKRLNDR